MALYEGLSREGSSAPAARRVPVSAPQAVRTLGSQGWRSMEARVAPRTAAASGSFLDSFLGSGSAASLKQAFQGGKSPARAAQAPQRRASPPPARPARLTVVGAGDETLPQGRKGLGRAVLIALGLAMAVATLRPWQREGVLKADWSALLRMPGTDADANKADAAAQQAKVQELKDAAALAALPLRPALGKTLALWQDASGRWWKADSQNALAPCTDPQGVENLGLPVLRGLAAHAEAYEGGRRELLDLPPGRLAELLPLKTTVASEVATVDLGQADGPVLLTFDGTRCLMGGGDWALAQRRLALVLADLAARRRRAAQVDLRFEGTAVVRPL